MIHVDFGVNSMYPYFAISAVRHDLGLPGMSGYSEWEITSIDVPAIRVRAGEGAETSLSRWNDLNRRNAFMLECMRESTKAGIFERKV